MKIEIKMKLSINYIGFFITIFLLLYCIYLSWNKLNLISENINILQGIVEDIDSDIHEIEEKMINQ